MVLLLTSFLAFAQPSPPPSAPPSTAPSASTSSAGHAKLGVGIAYDLGIVPLDVSIGWAGQLFVAVSDLIGFSCFGGRAVMVPASDDVMFGLESTYCRDISFRVDAAARSAGFFVGVRQKMDEGQYGSFQLDIGYSGGSSPDNNATWEGMYVRPRGGVIIERGPLAFEAGPFLQLPILFTQKVDGDRVGAGMLVRVGVEVSVYVGRFGN
jgi:hypothetical protein